MAKIEPVGNPYEVNGFILQVVRMTKEVLVDGVIQEAEGYTVHAKPAKDGGYIHAMYTSQSDAEIVMERYADRFDWTTYRVNFTSDLNPVTLVSGLSR